MTQTIRAAFPTWPETNHRLRERVAGLTEAQLAHRPSPDRWPLWATIGHLACQRVFWLCDAAGEPGAAESPFPNAGSDCPGDDDLEHVWSADRLADALDATFAIVERCLDTWTLATLEEVVRHDEWEPGWAHSRGMMLQRVFAHDVSHVAELNESLAALGVPQVDIWS